MQEEEHYRRLWETERWGRREPNEDERLRADSIINLLKTYVVQQTSTPETNRILDLGCGRGWLTPLLSNYGEVIGVDPTVAGIVKARCLFPLLDFRVGHAEDLLSTVGAGYFGLVVASEVIEHITDEDKPCFMSSIHRLLIRGGYAILTTPRGELWDLWKQRGFEEQPIEEWITEPALDQLGEAVGFKVVARDRVFLPRFTYDFPSRVATSPVFEAIASRLPRLRILTQLRNRCGIYQVVLLKRVEIES